MSHGVIWITGLAGAGKTTLSSLLVDRLRIDHNNVIRLDGDDVRQIMGNDLGHDRDARLKNAHRISRFCQYLSEQGMIVVCATMSLFPEIWEWNRTHLTNYRMVYIKTSMEELKYRDQKGLYSGSANGRVDNVVGCNQRFHEPEQPDLMVENSVRGGLPQKVTEIYDTLHDQDFFVTTESSEQ
jgi:cytidine diphosphoramidate kinase